MTHLHDVDAPTPACVGHDPELFFPLGDDGPHGVVESGALAQLAEARAVCATCPVREACLDIALRRGEVGVWGGTTSAERRAIRQRRRAEPA